MNDPAIRDLIQRLQSVISTDSGVSPLHEPVFMGNEKKYVNDCIDTGWVSSAGAYVDRFERAIAEYTGARRAVAVVNGTAGLRLALQMCGAERGVEVLIPALSFVATANAVMHTGAMPHFLDVDTDDFCLNAAEVHAYLSQCTARVSGRLIHKKTQRPIVAMVVMHCFGATRDPAAYQTLADTWGIALIEDAAEAMGSFYNRTHLGRFGQMGVISFNGNKVITTGGGGAILTDDDALADRLKHLSSTAKLPHAWAFEHDAVGYNDRMPNINAALGLAQLECLPEFLDYKRQLHHAYTRAFQGCEHACLWEPEAAGNLKCNHWLNTLILEDHVDLQSLLHHLHAQGILARPVWTPLNTLPMYQDAPSMKTPVTQRLSKQLLSLPSGVKLAL